MNINKAVKFIIPGKPQDTQLKQSGHPGLGAHPAFKKTGLLNQKAPIKKTIIPNRKVINILSKFGFRSSLIAFIGLLYLLPHKTKTPDYQYLVWGRSPAYETELRMVRVHFVIIQDKQS